MIAVLLDRGLPRTAAGLLREIGWDVQHVSERGMSQAEDVAIIEVARQEGARRRYTGRRFSCLAWYRGRKGLRFYGYAWKASRRIGLPR